MEICTFWYSISSIVYDVKKSIILHSERRINHLATFTKYDDSGSMLSFTGTALVIPPLQTIEIQMCTICEEWGIKYLNLGAIDVNSIADHIAAEKPFILISSIEKINNPEVQKQLFNLKLDYIAIDEAQVLDPETGWTEFRPYSAETWAFLRARFRCPFLLLSATMEEESLTRIARNLDLPREKIKVLYTNPDRGNIYHQRRILKEPVDVMNIQKYLGFIVPAIMDVNFKKCQLFCSTRHSTDIICAWLKTQLEKMRYHIPHSIMVEKLTGNNTRDEKERVMESFKSGLCQVLVCTDVAGMGIDVKELTFSVNIGIPKNAWKMKQQSGRLGRNGEQAVDITLIFPQKGSAAPEASLRKAMKGNSCIRSALNTLFVLANPLVDYTTDIVKKDCVAAGCELSEMCICSLCKCCTVCTDECICVKSSKDQNIIFKSLLGFGDENFSLAEEILRSEASEDTSEDESDEGDIENMLVGRADM